MIESLVSHLMNGFVLKIYKLTYMDFDKFFSDHPGSGAFDLIGEREPPAKAWIEAEPVYVTRIAEEHTIEETPYERLRRATDHIMDNPGAPYIDPDHDKKYFTYTVKVPIICNSYGMFYAYPNSFILSISLQNVSYYVIDNKFKDLLEEIIKTRELQPVIKNDGLRIRDIIIDPKAGLSVDYKERVLRILELLLSK